MSPDAITDAIPDGDDAAAVRIELAGPDAAAHDYHVGQPGAFAAAVAALTRARADRATLEVDTPLTRSSYRALAAMPVVLAAHGVTSWRLRVLAAADVPADAVARTIPRLAMALPHALHAAARARALGIASVLVDAPYCLLGPFAATARTEQRRAHAEPCTACRARGTCPGVDAVYLARFGAGELAPLG
ncbi:MAG: hypothetical protein IPL61_03790 [Myxococcales bacterium]|nr:hypothetical protein [Myxococcales bacterium]